MMRRASILVLLAALQVATGPARGADSTDESAADGVRWRSARAAYDSLSALEGVWRGVGEGKWGSSTTTRTFAATLDGKAYCNDGVSRYPPQERNPDGEVHRSHAMLYLTDETSNLRMTEYDNEGFVSSYLLDLDASQHDRRWVFVLDSGKNLPPDLHARMTFIATGENEFTENFELDFDGDGYVHYLTNRMVRSGNGTPGTCTPVEP